MARSGLHRGGQRRCPVHLPAHRLGTDDGPDFHRGRLLCRALPPPSRCSGRADRRFHAARIDLVDYPALRFHGDLRLGRCRLLQEPHSSPRFHRSLRRRETMDVEAGTRRRPARDQRTARARRPRRQADHDFAGRHPQLLRPRVPHEAGRAARPLHRRLVPRHQAGHLSSFLHPILRHPALRHDRLHHRAWSPRSTKPG